jgi:hypothetical protein
MEGQHFDPGDGARPHVVQVGHVGDDPLDVLDVVGQAEDQDEPDPDLGCVASSVRQAGPGETPPELERRRQLAARDPAATATNAMDAEITSVGVGPRWSG